MLRTAYRNYSCCNPPAGINTLALAAYHDAIDRADTTAADCNYQQLSKVHGQMGELFYWQDLLQSAIHAYDMGYWNALKNKDTLLALAFFSQKSKCYYDLGDKGCAKTVIHKVRDLYLQHGDTLSANKFLRFLAKAKCKHYAPLAYRKRSN